jgi:hypothetical protein
VLKKIVNMAAVAVVDAQEKDKRQKLQNSYVFRSFFNDSALF